MKNSASERGLRCIAIYKQFQKGWDTQYFSYFLRITRSKRLTLMDNAINFNPSPVPLSMLTLAWLNVIANFFNIDKEGGGEQVMQWWVSKK